MKKAIIFLAIILLCGLAFGESITDTAISYQVRLGEKITVSGQYNNLDLNAYVLCRFVVTDSNSVRIDRWTDEYTFSDGSFYAEKTAIEPPYYRGDTFTMTATCGVSTTDLNFSIIQPISIAHPIQKGWEYAFDQGNLDAITIFVTFFALIVVGVLSLTFIVKKGGSYAS